MDFVGLFGDNFELIEVKQKSIKDVVDKSKEIKKTLKSKKTTLNEQLDIINKNVKEVLGKQTDNVLVIRTRKDLDDYISSAIEAGSIAIDTETNNSLCPITCKIMGLCLYVPGLKQAYIPVNHVDNNTGNRLSQQVTENDLHEVLQKIEDAHIFSIFHNYKFDYKVIKCTCNIEVHCDWDTLIAAKLIDENEPSAGLKQQYISKIDTSQEKYSIDHLFENIQYAQVSPEIFALYAATDSMMTYKLYEWQKPIMEQYEKENPDRNPYKLFREVEMPCIQVIAEMELKGIGFDKDFANRLKLKYESNLAELDKEIEKELNNYSNLISDWRLTPEANRKPIKKGKDKVEIAGEKFQYKNGHWYNNNKELNNFLVEAYGLNSKDYFSKSLSEQLSEPISLSSPTQLAILLYDILKVPVINKDTPRGTGTDILEKLQDKYNICKYLVERRTIEKLLSAFILSLPESINKKTGKIHCHLNQYGAKTGRTSCSDPNLQQIPAHIKSIRMLFMADTKYNEIESQNNFFEIEDGDDVETIEGWKNIRDISCNDVLVTDEGNKQIKSIVKNNNYIIGV